MSATRTLTIGGLVATIDREQQIIRYRAGMTIDADGGLHTYHPDDIGTDALKNARTKSGKWVGVVTVNGRPYIAPSGYYVSTTTYQRKKRALEDPRRYLDSERIPFIAIPPQLIRSVRAIVIGSRGIATNTINGRTCEFMGGDVGPTFHLGEGSRALAAALGINSDPRKGGTSRPVIDYVIHAGQPFTFEGETFELQRYV